MRFCCILVLLVQSGRSRGMARRRRATQVRQDQAFKGRQFTAEVILWARLAKGSVRRSRMEGQGEGVRWYLMLPISCHVRFQGLSMQNSIRLFLFRLMDEMQAMDRRTPPTRVRSR
jgi:hypothetical protein